MYIENYENDVQLQKIYFIYLSNANECKFRGEGRKMININKVKIQESWLKFP